MRSDTASTSTESGTPKPRAPIERFPKTDPGWQEAWQRFGALEPRATPLGSTGSAPGVAGAPAQSAPRTNGAATASLVLGIVGVVFGWFPVVGLILGVLAVVFAYVGMQRAGGGGPGRGMAVVLVLGIIASVFGVLSLLVFKEVGQHLDTLEEQINQQLQSIATPAP